MNSELRARLGALLRSAYIAPRGAPLPQSFHDLLDKLQACDADAPSALPDDEFKTTLTRLIPELRGYARSLSRSSDLADDLVQDTMVKAWRARASFQAGTNMRAWCCTILRNLFITECRRARFRGDCDDVTAERLLAREAGQEAHIELANLRRALDELPPAQREAVMLVGAAGLAYEDAACITNTVVGTVKSRVSRARAALVQLMEDGQLAPRRSTVPGSRDATVESLMAEADALASA